jgi:uncharacterized membrane protein
MGLDIVSLAFPDRAAAEQALQALRTAQREEALQLEDAAVVARDSEADGAKVHIHHSMGDREALGDTGLGALVGGLVGLLAGPIGVAVGAALGGAWGYSIAQMDDVDEFSHRYLKDLGADLTPGAAAVVWLGESRNGDEVVRLLAPHGGRLLRTTLDEADAAKLQAALDAPGSG